MNEKYAENCAYCDFFRFEKRVIDKVNRTEFCAARSSYWPDAKRCSYYRIRACFIKINGLDPDANSGSD